MSELDNDGMIRITTAVVVAGVVLLVSSCASAMSFQGEFPRGEMDAPDTFDAAAQWLPGDSKIVTTASADPDHNQWRKDLLPTERLGPDADPLSSVWTLEQEFRAESVERMGFDPFDSHAIALAVLEDGAVAILFGVDDEPEGLSEHEINGETVYSQPLDELVSHDSLQLEGSLYLWPSTEPEGAMVMATDPQLLPVGTTSALSDQQEYEEFRALFGDAKGASLAAASPLGWVEQRDDIDDDREPEPIQLNSGEETYDLVIQGDPEMLEEIDPEARDQLRTWGEPVEESGQSDDTHLIMELLNIYGGPGPGLSALYHQLSGEFEHNRMGYEIRRTDGSNIARALALTVMTIGVGYASVAVTKQEPEPEQDPLFDLEEELKKEPCTGSPEEYPVPR